jgi:hypothetical protein
VSSAKIRQGRYDELLMSGFDRVDARDRVREAVDRVLNSWRKPA